MRRLWEKDKSFEHEFVISRDCPGRFKKKKKKEREREKLAVQKEIRSTRRYLKI